MYIIIIIITIIILAVQPWSLFQSLDPIDSRYDSLDGGSAHRKAYTYTQGNTNAE
jgi:hypothetical protein